MTDFAVALEQLQKAARAFVVALAKEFRDLAERLDPTSRAVGRTLEFPHGRTPWMRNLPAIILCRDAEHRQRIAGAFPIPGAYYAIFGAALYGMRTDKLIVFEPSIPSHLTEEQRERRANECAQYLNVARTRLAPGCSNNFILL